MKSPQLCYSPTISTKFLEMFVTRSIDKFSYRISTQGIIIMVESRACDKNIDYFRAIKSRDRSVQKLNAVCHCLKTLPYLSDLNYFLLPFICVENATRYLTSYCNFQG